MGELTALPRTSSWLGVVGGGLREREGGKGGGKERGKEGGEEREWRESRLPE